MKQTRMANAAMVEKLPIGPDDFESMVQDHQRRIYRTLLFLVRDPDIADTLTQDCFLRAFRNLSSFRCESSLLTWLMRIAINLAHDHNKNRRWAFWRRLRRMDRIDAVQTPDSQHSPELVLIEAELVDSIRSAVEKLSERQKTVFMMRFIEDMPIEEIAEVLKLEPGTVKTHLYRAIEAVKRACAK